MTLLRKLLFQCGIYAQDERPHWVYWAPVLVGLGIAFYFLLPQEPSLWASGVPLVILLGALVRLRSRPKRYISVLAAALLVLGLFVASVRSSYLATQQLDRVVSVATVEGVLLSKEATERGARFVLSPTRIEGMEPQLWPTQVRLTLSGVRVQDIPEAGAEVRVLARLLPISGPFYPSGYDFRRQAFFEGLGATGIAFKIPEIVGSASQKPLAETWREAMQDKVSAVLSGVEGAIATALITGERGAIDSYSNEVLRAAGIAHIISISGMHIGMLGGMIFFLIRVGLALIGPLALRFSVRKIAAGAALISICFYTWLVGAPIPAVRAMIMAGLVFVAVMLDRRALTLRTVALSAFVILLIYPESLLTAGFQMSFAAILFLVAGYEAWVGYRATDPFSDEKRKSGIKGLIMWPFTYAGGIIASSVLAGLATMPFGAFHFQRLQLFGVLGNLIAVPLTGLVIMPAGAASWVAMPFGLEEWPLRVMGWGLHLMMSSAEIVAKIPYATLTVPVFPMWILALMVFSGLWLCLWAQKWRFWALPVLLASIVLVPLFAIRPSVLVSEEGQVAVSPSSQEMLMLKGSTRGQLAQMWSRGFFDGQPLTRLSKREELSSENFLCDSLGCVLTKQNGFKIAFPLKLSALLDDCQKADLIVVPDITLKKCAQSKASPEKTLVIDKSFLRHYGSVMISETGEVSTSRGRSLDGNAHKPSGAGRPWQVKPRPPRS